MDLPIVVFMEFAGGKRDGEEAARHMLTPGEGFKCWDGSDAQGEVRPLMEVIHLEQNVVKIVLRADLARDDVEPLERWKDGEAPTGG